VVVVGSGRGVVVVGVGVGGFVSVGVGVGVGSSNTTTSCGLFVASSRLLKARLLLPADLMKNVCSVELVIAPALNGMSLYPVTGTALAPTGLASGAGPLLELIVFSAHVESVTRKTFWTFGVGSDGTNRRSVTDWIVLPRDR
jgi:hypothetical protein